jgi:hypothetical protein
VAMSVRMSRFDIWISPRESEGEPLTLSKMRR